MHTRTGVFIGFGGPQGHAGQIPAYTQDDNLVPEMTSTEQLGSALAHRFTVPDGCQIAVATLPTDVYQVSADVHSAASKKLPLHPVLLPSSPTRFVVLVRASRPGGNLKHSAGSKVPGTPFCKRNRENRTLTHTTQQLTIVAIATAQGFYDLHSAPHA